MPLLDKLIDRVRGRTPGTNDPSQTLAPTDKDLGPGVDQAPGPGLMQRVRDKVLSVFNRDEKNDLEEKRQNSLAAARGDIPKMQWMIRRAAATSTLILIQYHNTWRLAEPYSYRRTRDGGEPRFFMYCLLHDSIHGIYLSRCGGLQNTDQPYSPRWKVEII